MVAIVLAVAGWGSVARADEILPSNLGVLETLTEQAVAEVLSSLTLPSGKAVTLMASTPHEANAFLLGRLAMALADEGYDVTLARTAVANGGEATEETTPASGNGGKGGGAAEAAVALNEAEAEAEDDDSEEDGDSGSGSVESLDTFFGPGSYPPGTILDVELLQFGVRYAEAKRKMWVGSVEFTRVAGVYVRVAQLEGPSGEWVGLAKAEKHHWDRVSGRQRVLAEGAAYPFAEPTLNAPGLSAYVEPTLVVGVVGSLIYLFYANQN